MTAPALPWFEDEDPKDLLRWSVAAAAVVLIHVALIAGYTLWHQPNEAIGDETSVVSVELAPIDSIVDANQHDVAAGPEDMVEQKATPDVQKQPDQPKVDQPPPPPTVTTPDVALPMQKPPEKVEEQLPPAPRTTARVMGGAPRVKPSWEAMLVKHLQEFKRYPREAELRNEQGIVLLGFSVDRGGRVLAHRIVRSSGYPALDAEVMQMIERAQPLPAFPAGMTQARLDLTVPIRFSLR